MWRRSAEPLGPRTHAFFGLGKTAHMSGTQTSHLAQSPSPQSWLNALDEPGLHYGPGQLQRLYGLWATCKRFSAHAPTFLGHWLNRSPTCTAFHAHQHPTPTNRCWTCATSPACSAAPNGPCLGHPGPEFRKTRTLSETRWLGRPSRDTLALVSPRA